MRIYKLNKVDYARNYLRLKPYMSVQDNIGYFEVGKFQPGLHRLTDTYRTSYYSIIV